MGVEPIPDEPAALATCDGERALVIADFHAGIEAGLRRDGVELPDHSPERRESLRGLVDRKRPDRLVFLGDLGHAIGDPGREEREELLALFDALPADLPVTLVKGNHDGDTESLLERVDQPVEITPGHGVRIGEVGFAHGHTWPSPDVLAADIVCVAHEHPVVRLEDEVGGARVERVWLRGDLDPGPFREFHDADIEGGGELVVCPGFNDLSGGTWVNVDGQDFLAPFLPDALVDGEAYLLDGTRLGDYRRV
ncbi:phosphoesterase [Halosimplex carlsbadense 2-9-1]|uniref:Phosphoesterase n=1 Tax=Halosimplex carlsbadense 2-9-1 TaxID=797114 RepID=M0CMR1_9EURY|nr:metallophosphoesterase [Halosimplex carlsbadense]ELZ24511.1 phosphoesterase [Halosimplex carlsbadense 2-9-1]